jgi:hypothetical protein
MDQVGLQLKQFTHYAIFAQPQNGLPEFISGFTIYCSSFTNKIICQKS